MKKQHCNFLNNTFYGNLKDKEDQELFEKFLSENQEKRIINTFSGICCFISCFKALFTDENNIHKQLQEKDLTKKTVFYTHIQIVHFVERQSAYYKVL